MPGNASSNIDNILPRFPVYEGHDPVSGYLKFYSRPTGNSIGFDIFRGHTHNYSSIGPSATLALGLTELCARLGRGKVSRVHRCRSWHLSITVQELTTRMKVYYFLKGHEGKLLLTYGKWPDSYIQLPELLFVDYKWTEKERDNWLQSPHWQRLDLLSARGNQLHTAIPTMPITLCYELDDYPTIQFVQALGATILYYNSQGAMYMGFLEDLDQVARFVRPSGNQRPRWVVPEAQVAQFQVRSGRAAAERLCSLYDEQRPESLFLYATIVEKSIQAHAEWVANGGYTVESDSDLGKKIQERVDKVREQRLRAAEQEAAREVAREAAVTAGRRLQQLMEEVETWPEALQLTLEDFRAAADTGVAAVSRFTVQDEHWATLSIQDRETIIDIWELEQEAARRTPEA